MKRLGYVVMTLGAIIGIGFNINDAVKLTQSGLPTGIWTAIGLAVFFIGVLLLLHYKETLKVNQTTNSTLLTMPLKPRSRPNSMVQAQLNNQMRDIHGHDDPFGITADAEDGIDWNEIMKRNCTACGKPRNQRGGYGT